MANTYTQLYTQIVFSPKGRRSLIPEKHRERLEKYICGIVQNKKSKVLAIYCNPDHIHILISFHPAISISDLARDIKASSSLFINSENWFHGKFQWQEGFGAFSYSKRELDGVIKYIHNQPEHHRKKTFKEEYLGLLKENDLKYDEKYLFEWYDIVGERHENVLR